MRAIPGCPEGGLSPKIVKEAKFHKCVISISQNVSLESQCPNLTYGTREGQTFQKTFH